MNFPTSPIDQHNRLILAFTDDLLSRDRTYRGSKAVVEIARQVRAMPPARAGPATPGAKCPLVSAIRGPSLSQGENQ
jgi:hypothetical protein